MMSIEDLIDNMEQTAEHLGSIEHETALALRIQGWAREEIAPLAAVEADRNAARAECERLRSALEGAVDFLDALFVLTDIDDWWREEVPSTIDALNRILEQARAALAPGEEMTE
jgi:hypothetical protein